MRMPISVLALIAAVMLPTGQTQAQRVPVLRGIRAVNVTPTLVSNPEKVKEEFGANLVEDSLRNALRSSSFEISDDARVKAHIVLDEFTSGNGAKRVLVGFGAGRSTISGRLVFQDDKGTDIANVPLKVRGNLLWNSYQGGTTQRRQATNAFDQKLAEEIARLK